MAILQLISELQVRLKSKEMSLCHKLKFSYIISLQPEAVNL